MTSFWLNFSQIAESARIQYLKNHLPYEVVLALLNSEYTLVSHNIGV